VRGRMVAVMACLAHSVVIHFAGGLWWLARLVLGVVVVLSAHDVRALGRLGGHGG